MLICSVTTPKLTLSLNDVNQKTATLVRQVIDEAGKIDGAVNVRITIVVSKILNAYLKEASIQGKKHQVFNGQRESESFCYKGSIDMLKPDQLASDLILKIKNLAPCHLERLKFNVQLLDENNQVLREAFPPAFDFNQPRPEACVIL